MSSVTCERKNVLNNVLNVMRSSEFIRVFVGRESYHDVSVGLPLVTSTEQGGEGDAHAGVVRTGV